MRIQQVGRVSVRMAERKPSVWGGRVVSLARSGTAGRMQYSTYLVKPCDGLCSVLTLDDGLLVGPVPALKLRLQLQPNQLQVPVVMIPRVVAVDADHVHIRSLGQECQRVFTNHEMETVLGPWQRRQGRDTEDESDPGTIPPHVQEIGSDPEQQGYIAGLTAPLLSQLQWGSHKGPEVEKYRHKQSLQDTSGWNLHPSEC